MPNLSLSGFDDEIWARAMTRAQMEGWPRKDLIQALLDGYARGTIVPPGRPPMAPATVRDGVVVLRFTCPHCHKEMKVLVRDVPGFAYMNFHTVDCPHCGKVTERMLPADILDIER